MAIKLLKKSKQRKLLEEVKRTAMGIGQDNSWKDEKKTRGFRPSVISTFNIEDDEMKELKSRKVYKRRKSERLSERE